MISVCLEMSGAIRIRTRQRIAYCARLSKITLYCPGTIAGLALSFHQIPLSICMLGPFESLNCDYHLEALRHLPPSLPDEVANLLASALVQSHIAIHSSMALWHFKIEHLETSERVNFGWSYYDVQWMVLRVIGYTF